MDEKELEALHKALSQQFDIGDYDTFKSKMQTPDDRKNFYNAVGEKGFDLGDFDEYEKRLGGVKKKSVLSISRNPHCNLATIYPNHNHLLHYLRKKAVA